jgi:hypothetical protein
MNQQASYIRLLHAAPNAPAVDIYANDGLLAGNLTYKELTRYIPVMPGMYTVQVFPAGQRTNPVVQTSLLVRPQTAQTIAAEGVLPNIGLISIPEMYMPHQHLQDMTKAYVRFVHLSPNAPAVDITLPEGTKLFADVPFKTYTDYQAVDPGVYTLLVKPANSNQTVLTVPDVRLRAGTAYTIYAVGLVGGTPPLEAISSVDGNY